MWHLKAALSLPNELMATFPQKNEPNLYELTRYHFLTLNHKL